MKPLWNGHGLLRIGFWLVFFLDLAHADEADRVFECLRASDLVCAQEANQRLVASRPDSVDASRVGAALAFYEGNYQEAVDFLDELEELGVDLSEQTAHTPYRSTLEASRGMISITAEGVDVRVSTGVDRIVGEEAVMALGRIRSEIDSLFGGGPEHTIVLDIFPTGTRFIGASSLPRDAVQATGVIALSKWTRLLLTSPRALARGYPWKDTVAHEYIHLVVSFRSADRAPVWLQEGLAKYFEGYWEDGSTGEMSVHHQSLLADAVRNDDFVPFERFQNSMAYLDSGEEAALAFAQVSTMVQYLVERGGVGVLPDLMDRLAEGESAEATVARLANHTDFEDFEQGWLRWLREQRLESEDLSTLPVVLDGSGDEYDTDPLLASRPDLARFTRLGDLLFEAGRPLAALVEYEKAEDPNEPPSPLLMARRAECLSELDREQEALTTASEGVRLYPEFGALRVIQARLLEHEGQNTEARRSWVMAHDLNPYDPEVQQALIRLYTAEGNSTARQRHERYAHILETGGLAPDSGTEESRP